MTIRRESALSAFDKHFADAVPFRSNSEGWGSSRVAYATWGGDRAAPSF